MKSIRAEWRPGTADVPGTAARRPLRIVVVGCGHIGLVTAASLASFGHTVVAIDTDARWRESLSRGDLRDMQEPGLGDMVRAQIAAQRLSFTAEISPALPGADLLFVAVAAPAQADGSVGTGAIDEVARQLAVSPHGLSAVVIQSTVPTGTTKRFQAQLQKSTAAWQACVPVLACPAFMRRGCAVADFKAPARIIVGDDSPAGAARNLLLEVCAPMIDAGVTVLTMDTCSAELSKQATNAMLAIRIGFMNEIAAIAAATGADIESVRDGIGSDRRIGTEGLRPGLGYGGPSLARDVAALRETARRHNLRSDLLLAAERVNDRQRCWAFGALRRDLGSQARMRGLRVAVWGLAFKPGTNDIHNAPSLALIDRLARAGASVTVFDPAAIENARRDMGEHRRIAWAESAEHALAAADVLMLVTEWPEFVAFDPIVVWRALRRHTVYDCRNALDRTKWESAGLRVVQIGRPTRNASPGADQWIDVDEAPAPSPQSAAACEPAGVPSDPFDLVA